MHQSYIHFLKTHLNWKPRYEHEIENVDKIFTLKITDMGDKIDLFVLSSGDQWTSVYKMKDNKLEEWALDMRFISDQYTLNCDVIQNKYILQVCIQNICLLSLNGQSELCKIDDFEANWTIKHTYICSKTGKLFVVDSGNHIYIYMIEDGMIKQNTELKNFLTDKLTEQSEIISFSSNLSSGKERYFIAYSNSVFEIYDDKKRMFKSRENIKAMPSIITDASQKHVDGNNHVFTDLCCKLTGKAF